MIHTLSYTTTKVHSIKHNISRTLHPLNTLLIHCNKNQDNIQQTFIHVSIMNDTHLLVIHNNTTTKVHSTNTILSITTQYNNTYSNRSIRMHTQIDIYMHHGQPFISIMNDYTYITPYHTQQLKYTQSIQ